MSVSTSSKPPAPRDFETELARVEAAIGHVFADRRLLAEALSHSSFVNERSNLAPTDNERLEYLGDALVGAVVASLLFRGLPDAREGELTRRRAELVRTESLAAMATEFDLGPSLRLGKGEIRQGGREKPRLLASALEACFGAVLADAGPEVAFRVVSAHFAHRIDSVDGRERDFKSRVQELLQGMGRAIPVYRVVAQEGPEHEPRFEVALEVDGESFATGHGRSKLEAEQAAARDAFPRLESLPAPSEAAPESA